MTLVLPDITSQDEPSKRNGHISVSYRGYLVVYGGHKISDNDEHMTDSAGDQSSSSDDKYVWFYKVDTSHWKSMKQLVSRALFYSFF